MTFPVRRVAAPAILLVTALALSGCFGHSTTSSKPAASASPSATPTALPPLTVRSVVTRVIGDLASHERDRFGARAGALVQRYFRAAFLDPHRGKAGPRTFPGFTPQARALAVRDHAVLTGAAYAGADRIEPRSGTAYVSVLAPHGRPVGATVRVSLTLAVTNGSRTRPVTVAGRLLLTPTGHGWRIFGYDLAQSGNHARSKR